MASIQEISPCLWFDGKMKKPDLAALQKAYDA
jgi:hypothetical protein